MSDLKDNFYPSAEVIWFCIRLNNARKYCDITLKIMAKLRNVCENCVRILEEEKHRQLRKAESVFEAPSTLIHRRFQQLNISESP